MASSFCGHSKVQVRTWHAKLGFILMVVDHQAEILEQRCPKAAVIRRGRVIQEGAWDVLRRRLRCWNVFWRRRDSLAVGAPAARTRFARSAAVSSDAPRRLRGQFFDWMRASKKCMPDLTEDGRHCGMTRAWLFALMSFGDY